MSKETLPDIDIDGPPTISEVTEYVAAILALKYDIQERVIYLVGEIDEEAARQFMVVIHFLDGISSDPIRVILSCPGGEEEPGYAIHDAIKLANSPVLIDGIGQVASIAAVILQAGDVRRLSPNAIFMVHHGSITMPDHIEQDKIMSISRQLEVNNAKYHTLLANRTGIPVKEIREMSEAETFLSATEAVRRGFADFLWMPKKKSTKKLLQKWVDGYKTKE